MISTSHTAQWFGILNQQRFHETRNLTARQSHMVARPLSVLTPLKSTAWMSQTVADRRRSSKYSQIYTQRSEKSRPNFDEVFRASLSMSTCLSISVSIPQRPIFDEFSKSAENPLSEARSATQKLQTVTSQKCCIGFHHFFASRHSPFQALPKCRFWAISKKNTKNVTVGGILKIGVTFWSNSAFYGKKFGNVDSPRREGHFHQVWWRELERLIFCEFSKIPEVALGNR
jgi:hypothetical protein